MDFQEVSKKNASVLLQLILDGGQVFTYEKIFNDESDWRTQFEAHTQYWELSPLVVRNCHRQIVHRPNTYYLMASSQKIEGEVLKRVNKSKPHWTYSETCTKTPELWCFLPDLLANLEELDLVDDQGEFPINSEGFLELDKYVPKQHEPEPKVRTKARRVPADLV